MLQSDTIAKPRLSANDTVGDKNLHKTLEKDTISNNRLTLRKAFVPIPARVVKFRHPDSLHIYHNPHVFDNKAYNFLENNYKEVVSVFIPHKLVISQRIDKSIDTQPATNWLLFVLLLMLISVAWAKNNYANRLNQLLRGFVHPHYINQIKREGNIFKEKITIGLSFFYYFVISLFIYMVIENYTAIRFPVPNYVLAGLIFVFFVLFNATKASLFYLIGLLFEKKEDAYTYQINTLIINNISSFIIAPFLLVALFSNHFTFILICGILICMSIIYNLIRSFFIFTGQRKHNLFYNFLYLCTLEILPLLAIVRLIMR